MMVRVGLRERCAALGCSSAKKNAAQARGAALRAPPDVPPRPSPPISPHLLHLGCMVPLKLPVVLVRGMYEIDHQRRGKDANMCMCPGVLDFLHLSLSLSLCSLTCERCSLSTMLWNSAVRSLKLVVAAGRMAALEVCFPPLDRNTSCVGQSREIYCGFEAFQVCAIDWTYVACVRIYMLLRRARRFRARVVPEDSSTPNLEATPLLLFNKRISGQRQRILLH